MFSPFFSFSCENIFQPQRHSPLPRAPRQWVSSPCPMASSPRPLLKFRLLAFVDELVGICRRVGWHLSTSWLAIADNRGPMSRKGAKNAKPLQRQGTSMLCDNCHTTIEQPSHNNRAVVAQLCDNCHTRSLTSHYPRSITIWGIGGHTLAKSRQYIFPRVCIQELVQKWVQQIEHLKKLTARQS